MIRLFLVKIKKVIQKIIEIVIQAILLVIYFILFFPFGIFIRLFVDYLNVRTDSSWQIKKEC
jgi:ACR3 family arsenite efflux pump ArsB